MLGRILAWTAALVAGALIGVATGWAALSLGQSNFMESYGAWRFSRAAGSTAADPYTRAIIAREGLLALSNHEALYYSLYEDDQGRPLSESCIYELDGLPLAARWWSVTLYASDNFLARNTDSAHSADTTRLGNDGPWRVRIAPVRGDAVHWISSREARRGFLLMLRVYNPQRDFRASADALPRLTALSCAEGEP